jgi:N-acetylmuramoyl-L-alanine amidase
VLFLALYPSLALSDVQVAATRLWPSKEYTRLTIEALTPIRYTAFMVADPHRIVLDLEGVEPGPQFDALSGRLPADDPYIRSIRVGRFKPGVLRLVLDLKDEARAETFTLAPVGSYGHRLVLDIYPLKPIDPLMALVNELERTRAATTAPVSPLPPSTPAAPPAAAAAGSAPPAPALASPSPSAPPSPPPASASRLIIVAVDAGHGGEDPGALGPSGSQEKDVTLAIARKLKALIDAQPNMRAVLTRDGDYFVALHARVQKARRVQADLFVSVHADAFVKPHARGSSVYALSEKGATSVAAQWLAKRENDADLIGGVNLDVRDPHLKQTLLDLTQTATNNDSLKLARAVLGEVGEINALHKSSVEQAGFAVLKAPDVPSILVETAFITNPEEERRLRDDAYQSRMAAAILSGIKRYFAANPPLARAPRVALTGR